MDSRADGLAVALLWLSLVVGMTLHFTYQVSGMVYGLPFANPDAEGGVPWSNFVIKGLFYVLPFLLAVGAAGGGGRAYRVLNLAFTFFFVLANLAHVVGTAMAADDVLDYAQLLLLSAILVANLQLIRLSLRWLRSASAGEPARSTAA